jgi:adenylate cyclase
MPVEIERKFLVASDEWREQAGPGRRFCQGYLAHGQSSIRVRRADHQAYVTIKGQRDGIARAEYEYEIPVADAEEMLDTLCAKPLLEKTRYRVRHDGLDWEVDVFEHPAGGLVLAEIELQRVDQPVSIPAWAGIEVTDDLRGDCARRPPQAANSGSRPYGFSLGAGLISYSSHRRPGSV